MTSRASMRSSSRLHQRRRHRNTAGTTRSPLIPGRFTPPLDRWRALRDSIHRDVLARGLVSFLPHDDPRIAGTLDAVNCADRDALRQPAAVMNGERPHWRWCG